MSFKILHKDIPSTPLFNFLKDGIRYNLNTLAGLKGVKLVNQDGTIYYEFESEAHYTMFLLRWG